MATKKKAPKKTTKKKINKKPAAKKSKTIKKVKDKNPSKPAVITEEKSAEQKAQEHINQLLNDVKRRISEPNSSQISSKNVQEICDIINKENNSIRHKVAERLVHRGIIQQAALQPQLKQMYRWSEDLVQNVNETLLNCPAGLLNDELIEKLKDDHKLIFDPPSKRFKNALFRRSDGHIFISPEEARALRHPEAPQEESAKKKEEPIENKPGQPSITSPRVEELQQSGSFTAESDANWFDNYGKTDAPTIEELESDVAEKTKTFLKARRELIKAKSNLSKRYQEENIDDVSSNELFEK